MTINDRLVCVSNRLPVTCCNDENGLSIKPSSGGLVTALAPILNSSGGAWIGWPGPSGVALPEAVERAVIELSADAAFDLVPVMIAPEDVEDFYLGYSNRIIWPLFHDLHSQCNFNPGFWRASERVTKTFADVTLRTVKPMDLVWIHDYHLMGLGGVLRAADLKNRLAFFLHVPFPSPDIFLKLPWRTEVMRSLLKHDLVGFQTRRDLNNFGMCLEACTKLKPREHRGFYTVQSDAHEVRLGAFPISIDVREFSELAAMPDVRARADQIRGEMKVERMILSVDRLDYTKGIPDRIRAMERLFQIEPSLKGQASLLQVVVPSREDIPEYQTLRAEIEQLVTKVNGPLTVPGWTPIHHMFRSVSRNELVALYLAADIALITPLKDGMNLVAKEFCAARVDDDGVLILSEFAGVADELGSAALLVNPYDIDGVAETIGRAVAFSATERRRRMMDLRVTISSADVYRWAATFLDQLNFQSKRQEGLAQRSGLWHRLRHLLDVFDA